GSKHQNLAIQKQSTPANAILPQSLSRSSRTTSFDMVEASGLSPDLG
ncbi:hypothetical protein ACVJ6Q_008709, partial [Bradyrhizobium elkanii]